MAEGPLLSRAYTCLGATCYPRGGIGRAVPRWAAPKPSWPRTSAQNGFRFNGASGRPFSVHKKAKRNVLIESQHCL